MKSPTLQRAFDEFNSQYFNGSLKCRVSWGNIKGFGKSGPYREIGAKYEKQPKLFYIKINRRYKNLWSIWAWTLLHEMVHVKVWNRDRSKDGHGHLFQREMKRLALAGAFRSIW